MLPLALILKGQGAVIAGSDRSRDQGRTPEKFAWLETLGFNLFPQDGSGITSADQVLVAVGRRDHPVLPTVRAPDLGCQRMDQTLAVAARFRFGRSAADRPQSAFLPA